MQVAGEFTRADSTHPPENKVRATLRVQVGVNPPTVAHAASEPGKRRTPPPNWRGNGATQYQDYSCSCLDTR